MKKPILYTVILLFFLTIGFFSCQQKQKEGVQKVSYRYSLQETGQTLSHESDEPMRYRLIDKSEKKLAFLHRFHWLFPINDLL
jgi:hypothetical protein